MKFCVGKQNSSAIELMRNCKFWKFKMERPPSWKSLNRKIATKNYPILMKFCTQQLMAVMRDQIWIFLQQMADGRHIENRFSYNSAGDCVPFQWNFEWRSSFFPAMGAIRPNLVPQNVFFAYQCGFRKNMSTTMAVIDVRPTYWQYFL